jgi:septal ring factor EnvC (AmiA/AmiB activator)
VDERRTLQRRKQEKSKVVKSLSQQIATQRGEIKKLQRDEKRLSQLVERLAKIIPAKPKTKSTKNNTTNNVASNKQTNQIIANNNALPSDEFAGANFATLKGKLRLPVRGDITNRFGASREDSGVSWKGLFIKANEGAEVKSVASGRVVFADWLRGFGNLVIVDHGDGYMSLYGNNQAILKQAGEVVRSGDAIASVGNSGGNEANGVYYELRLQSRPFDPLSWSSLN